MNTRDPKLTALLFNECLNRRDLAGLSALMTEDHLFLDAEGGRERGKDAMTEGWRAFFERWPDYRIHFHAVDSREDLVVVVGHASCVHAPLNGPALWTAKIRDDRVAEWRVLADTEENREMLGLPRPA